jgi:glycosyltransferase involved in cell wall biosynthesis
VSDDPRTPRTQKVGVILPVHNEEDRLLGALHALDEAITRVPSNVECSVVIVLDSCTDQSPTIAQQWSRVRNSMVVPCEYGNVGAARRIGCSAVQTAFPETTENHLWLATTDADSQVPPEWLATQLNAHYAGSDLWTGRVDVIDWSPHRSSTARRWHHEYQAEAAPVHGASMGIRASLYRQVGGFRDLETGEDRDLYERALSAGATLHHDASARVLTSARRDARAPMGFAHALTLIEASPMAISPPALPSEHSDIMIFEPEVAPATMSPA